MQKLIVVALFFFSLFLFKIEKVFSQNIIRDTFSRGISVVSKDSSMYVKLGFRFQTLYVGESGASSRDWQESMMIRRSRLKFDGWVFSPKVVYKIELGLSNLDTRSGIVNESGNTANLILDAVMKWNFSPRWSFWVGQAKLPGNRERVISSQKLQFVDRSLVNSRYTLDRDIGIQLRHKSKIGNMIFNQAIAISTGEGRDLIAVSIDHGRQYTGRLEFLPFGDFTARGDYFGSDLKREKSPKLSIGITGDYNNNSVRSRGNLGSFVTDDFDEYVYSDLVTVFIDGVFKYKGLSVASEYAYRSSSTKVNGFGYGKGITASLGYLLPSDIEIAGRFTSLVPISILSSIEETDEYMIGFSKYVVGHSLKIQSDFSYTEIKNNRKFYTIRVQFELAI